MNTSNGALILKHHERLYVSDLENYLGTFILAADGSVLGKVDAIMWFAAQQGGVIYFSNQNDNDYLYCLDLQNHTLNCLIRRPCSYITALEDKIFLLNEADSLIYQFDISTTKLIPLLKEEVHSFIPQAGILYCASNKGLLKINWQSGHHKVCTSHIPLCLNTIANGVVFADHCHDFTLSILKAGQKEPERISAIKTQSIAVSDSHLYAANLRDERSIVRVDIKSGETIRFCGEKADKLHIIDDFLYFQNQSDNNAWHKMPLAGGRSMRLLPALG